MLLCHEIRSVWPKKKFYQSAIANVFSFKDLKKFWQFLLIMFTESSNLHRMSITDDYLIHFANCFIGLFCSGILGNVHITESSGQWPLRSRQISVRNFEVHFSLEAFQVMMFCKATLGNPHYFQDSEDLWLLSKSFFKDICSPAKLCHYTIWHEVRSSSSIVMPNKWVGSELWNYNLSDLFDILLVTYRTTICLYSIISQRLCFMFLLLAERISINWHIAFFMHRHVFRKYQEKEHLLKPRFKLPHRSI